MFRLDLTPEQARALADELQKVADAGLEHHSIVRPIGAGLEGTLAYAATEYVAAESLDVALKHYAPAPIDKVLPFITQLAGAIDFARAAGIGLGALHPRDIFVTPDEARVTGFGVVQALEAIGVRAPVRRPYTAPERVGSGAWDVRADVYSLGTIAFELLTGRRPVGPEVGELGNTAGPYRAAIAQVIARALADEPAGRQPTALTLAAALDAVAVGEAEAMEGDVATVRAVAPAEVLPPVLLGDEEQPPAPTRTLVIEPEDVEIERDEDEAEIQLREEEALAYEPARPETVPELPAHAEAAPDDQELQLIDAPAGAEPEPEPSLFDLEREPALQREAVREAGPEPLPPVLPEPQAMPPPPPYSAPVLPPPSYKPAARTNRPRPVFLPIAVTLLLGLFVGFLAGYLVGSREAPTGTRAAGTTAADTDTVVADEGGANPRTAAGKPGSGRAGSTPSSERSAAPFGAGGSAAPPARAPERPASTASPPVAGAPISRPAPARGRLMVRSTPGGAQVFVNGRRRGTTPLAVRDLAPGAYTLRVTRPGFTEQSRRVTVTASGVREVNLRLEPVRAAAATFTGSLYVDSRPRGARVFLDGKDIGTTPMQAGDIRAGAHVVRLELKDHRSWTASTRVVAGEVTRVTGSLERQR